MSEAQVQKFTPLLFFFTIIMLVVMIFVLYPKQIEEMVSPTEDQDLPQRALLSAPKFGAGNPEALFIEFGDFECPACKSLAATIKRLEEDYRDRVQFVWIHTPNISDHPQSKTAAVAAQCSFEQNAFKGFHDALFENQEILGPNLYAQTASQLRLDIAEFNACLTDQETANTLLDHQRFAEISRVNETPTVAINDQFYSGDLTYESLKAALDEQLN